MDRGDLFIVVVVSSVIFGVAGAFIGRWDGERMFKADAIQHGFAHYDQETGAWGWNK